MIRDKIIIVEDDPGISKYLQAALRSHGYDILLAPDGKTALEMIASHCPDVLLLDLGLPDMDGSEIIRSVRTWSRMPIIIISARSAEIDKAAALDMGADDYLTKPFGTVELLAHPHGAAPHAHRRHERRSGHDGRVPCRRPVHRLQQAPRLSRRRGHAPDAERVQDRGAARPARRAGAHLQVHDEGALGRRRRGQQASACTWRTSAARSSRTRSSRSTFSPRSASATAWPTATESLSRTKSSRSTAPGAFLLRSVRRDRHGAGDGLLPCRFRRRYGRSGGRCRPRWAPCC